MELTLQSQNLAKASTLFRTNSAASQIMRCYARLCGRDYLIKTLGPLIKRVCDMEYSYEVCS